MNEPRTTTTTTRCNNWNTRIKHIVTTTTTTMSTLAITTTKTQPLHQGPFQGIMAKLGIPSTQEVPLYREYQMS